MRIERHAANESIILGPRATYHKTGEARTAGSMRRAPNPLGMGQCAAVKPEGNKCQAFAKSGSKYCAAHQGYRPKGTAKKKLEALKKARAMKVVRERAKKTKGGSGPIRKRPAARKILGAPIPCIAKTSAGKQCKNLPRPGDVHCHIHKR